MWDFVERGNRRLRYPRDSWKLIRILQARKMDDNNNDNARCKSSEDNHRDSPVDNGATGDVGAGGLEEVQLHLTCLPERYMMAKFTLSAYMLCWAALKLYQVRWSHGSFLNHNTVLMTYALWCPFSLWKSNHFERPIWSFYYCPHPLNNRLYFWTILSHWNKMIIVFAYTNLFKVLRKMYPVSCSQIRPLYIFPGGLRWYCSNMSNCRVREAYWCMETFIHHSYQ